jgi:hypothetical protein
MYNALNDLRDLPQSKGARIISFDNAELRPGIVNETYMLIVNGMKPYITMEVSLVPLIYVQKPDFWGVEVVGIQAGIGLPAAGPYTATLDVTHFMGHEGIEVIGSNKTQKLKP